MSDCSSRGQRRSPPSDLPPAPLLHTHSVSLSLALTFPVSSLCPLVCLSAPCPALPLTSLHLTHHTHLQVVYCETVSNPTLVVSDLPALATIAHAAGAALVVDNTFTPLAVTPTSWGADVVVHSLTKFVSGASDIIAGAVCGSAAFVASLMDLHTGKSE